MTGYLIFILLAQALGLADLFFFKYFMAPFGLSFKTNLGVSTMLTCKDAEVSGEWV